MIAILGGGPAGATAAIAARLSGAASVSIGEKSTFSRHKVCGEFLSPEASPYLEKAGIDLTGAAPIRRVHIRVGRRHKSFALREPALGVSRYMLDHALLSRAQELGARVVDSLEGDIQIQACGRRIASSRSPERLFGFKTHFSGPTDDAVSLYIFEGGYVGVNPVENGLANVCGVLPERILRDHGFRPEAILNRHPPLAERLAPLNPAMPWLTVAPLSFGPGSEPASQRYVAGDALNFVDPFTGSGMLCAIASGWMAGQAAAQNSPSRIIRKNANEDSWERSAGPARFAGR